MFACVTLLISKTHFLLVALHLLTLRRLGADCQLGRGSGSSDGDSLLVVDGGDPTCAGVPRSPPVTAQPPNRRSTKLLQHQKPESVLPAMRRRLYMEHCIMYHVVTFLAISIHSMKLICKYLAGIHRSLEFTNLQIIHNCWM